MTQNGLDMDIQFLPGVGSVFLAEIMGIIGTDHGKSRFLMQPQNLAVNDCLLADSMILNLQIKMIRTENLAHLQSISLCVLIFAVTQTLGNLACQTSRQGNQSLAMFFQQRRCSPSECRSSKEINKVEHLNNG